MTAKIYMHPSSSFAARAIEAETGLEAIIAPGSKAIMMKKPGEQRITEVSRGQKRLKWVKKRGRQEVLDLHVYNYCAYVILNPDIGRIKSKLTPKEPEKKELPKSTTPPINRGD